MTDLNELLILLQERGLNPEVSDTTIMLEPWDDNDLAFSLEANPSTIEWEMTIFNRNLRDDVDSDYGEGVTVSTMMCSDGVVEVEPRILADWVARFIAHLR